MNYLFNNRNRLYTATLAATNPVASQVVYRSDTDEKDGGGLVSLSGDFTGANDATYDVEISDTASSTPRLSAPVFSGIGSGSISALTASGLASQQFVVTLEDLGTETRQAYCPFQSATLRARDSGTPGNLITLTIDASGLTDAATDYATQGDIGVGSNEFRGDEWDFGAKQLNEDGTIPADAPRIRFGYDPQVYRAYKTFDAGYVFSFSPPPVRAVQRGTPVYLVTGSRTVTITDGTDTDKLPGIVTVYDCLSAIRDDSTLVEVDGVIANDLTPNGQGATELSVWTQPYVVAITRDGSEHVARANINLSLGADVPTELLTIRCANARPPGAEDWIVTGEVSGRLNNARTGNIYNDGGYSFVIPQVPNPDGMSLGKINVKFIPVEDPDRQDPGFKSLKAVVGAAGVGGSWTFEYRQRPVEDCGVDGVLSGGPDADCLGITPPGDTQMSDDQRRRRLQRLTRVVRIFTQLNTTDVPADGYSSVDQDINYMKKAANAVRQVIEDLALAVELQPDARADSTAYSQDQQITVAISGVDYLFYASVPGTSAGSAPSFAGQTDVGDTVVDGGVTWTNNGKTALGLLDAVIDLLESDSNHLLGVTGTNEVQSWSANTAYALGTVKVFGGDLPLVRFEVTTGGTSHATTEPDWSTAVEIGDTVSDGTVTWTRVAGDSASTVAGAIPLDDLYIERYITAGVEIKAAAGLSANFDSASDQGDGCWRDDVDATEEFAYVGDAPYAPVLPNIYYHSSLQEVREDGSTKTDSTQEFGFGATFGCPQHLIPGDRIVVTITGLHGAVAYEAGDTILVQATRATPLRFGGGQTGSDELTFSVVGDTVGRLDDYVLDVSDPDDPNAYSDGGLGFTITTGAIDFALGDRFVFSVEAARYRWRKDGGSWSSAADIPTTAAALSDGLSVTFTGGAAPSWVVGDTWTFSAEAVNGVENLRQPTDARFAWTGSTAITVTPSGDTEIGGILLAEHSIPDGAEIRLQGSDDNFSSTPLNQVVPWREGNIWLAVTGDYAKYRVTVDESGSLSWLWLGEPFALELARTGGAELGKLVKRYRLPSPSLRKGLGGAIEHEALSSDTVDELIAMLHHACENDDRRFGIVPNSTRPEAAVVAYADDTLQVEDVFGFQPADPEHQLLSVSLELAAIP